MAGAQEWIGMGYIKGAFGIKGWVRIATSTEHIGNLLNYQTWRLNQSQTSAIYQIESGKVDGDTLLVKFKDVHTRDEAALLRGARIEVQRSEFAELESDEYYWADLIGLRVVNHTGFVLGKVTQLLETGAHDVLVLEREGKQHLIPFVAQYIVQVVLESDDAEQNSGHIVVDWEDDY